MTAIEVDIIGRVREENWGGNDEIAQRLEKDARDCELALGKNASLAINGTTYFGTVHPSSYPFKVMLFDSLRDARIAVHPSKLVFGEVS